jgi:hypothetical protein
MNSDQTNDIGQVFEFSPPLTVKFWEYDSGSGDDPLGVQTFSTSGVWGTGRAKR